MIETEQAISIDASIDRVWAYVRDIRRWANLFPGCKECTVINEHDSRWVLKVGAGGLVRTVNVLVHVDQWDGPERVNFSYKLAGDPVEGNGTYAAIRTETHATEVKLKVRVTGTGPMAPMWEAISKPLLPQLAKSFAGKLKLEIEAAADLSSSQDTVAIATPARFSAIGKKLAHFWRALFGSLTRCLNL